jgi:NADPH-dependent ferric siderophore reductase
MPGRFAEMVSSEIARAECRALVALRDDRPLDPFEHFAGLRANFLAHLIATRERLPQTTLLRRDTPQAATFAYAHGCEGSVASKSRLV